jgi:cation transporter-like permease
MIRKRAPWLIILFLSEMLTTTAMGFFEDEISRAVILALFLPLIISSGGNSGSQATTLIIRAIAIGEVKLRDWWRVMRREIFTGLTLGIILGVIGFIRVSVWHFAFGMYGQFWWLIGLTILVSLIGVIMWGSLSGSMLPFVLKKCGLDPATASAPFVATLVDVTGIVIYFNVAFFVLGGSLLAAPPAGKVEIQHKSTPETFQRLMHLDERWVIQKMYHDTNRNALELRIIPSPDYAKGLTNQQCNGAVEMYGEAQTKHWTYPDVMGIPVDIESQLPLLRCKNNTNILIPVEVPWEDKGKLISQP